MQETWKPVEGHESYEVSDLGRVRSFKGLGPKPARLTEPKAIQPASHTGGYLQLIVSDRGVKCRWYLHRLVLETFLGPIPEGMDVCHNNGIRTDNRLSNLRWATRKENLADTHKHGTHQYGEAHGRHKLSDADVSDIQASFGLVSAVEVADIYGVHRNHVWSIWRGAKRAYATPKRLIPSLSQQKASRAAGSLIDRTLG